jgi:aerobic-type carbon monoxide dehydrogenase small subunit (CoxS/CutS family)
MITLKVQLKINGIPRQIIVDSQLTLLDLLRKELHLTGAKQSCDQVGQCGACTVIVNGKAMRSCLLRVAKLDGAEIITIEGLGTPENPHLIQEAFVLAGAIQCGFCTPGMIMSAKALLDTNLDPSTEEIKEALKHNLCRCTGYQKIIDAVKLAARFLKGEVTPKEVRPDPKGPKLGVSHPRPSALSMACGTAQYTGDIMVRDALELAVVQSPHAHALIKGIGIEKAAKMPGVFGVMTAKDIKGTNRLKIVVDDRPVLCEDKVRCIGDPIAVVAALTREQAVAAAKAVSVLINFTPKGIVQEYEIKLSIVNIKQRMTYDEVNKLFAGDNELARKYQDFKGMLFSMKDLAKALKEKRKKEGCIDFDLPECKVLLDALGKPIEIIKLKRGSAEGIIEEFMLAANRTVAEHAYWLEVPFIYRVHKDPDEEDLYNLNEFLQAFDYRLNLQQRVVPMHFQSILEQVKGKPEERSVNTIMLRSMQHAAYLEQPTGHFGLATTYYAHFTSPIRRYPDLMIHRIIKETLTGTIPAKRKQKLAKLVAEAAEQSSIMERIAEEAERESVDLKRVEFMQQFVGEEYEGIISGITNFGFFVELENTVEGLVHVSSLSDDYYQFDEKHYTLIGEHTKRSFKIGQPVRVLLAKANMDARTIDFELIKG